MELAIQMLCMQFEHANVSKRIPLAARTGQYLKTSWEYTLLTLVSSVSLMLIICKAWLTADFQYALRGMWLLLNMNVLGTSFLNFTTMEETCKIKNPYK